MSSENHSSCEPSDLFSGVAPFFGADPFFGGDPFLGADPGIDVEPGAGGGVSRPAGINTFELHFGQAIRVPSRPAGSLSFVPHFGHWIVLTESTPEPSAKTLSTVARRSPCPTDHDAILRDTGNEAIDLPATYTHPYASGLA